MLMALGRSGCRLAFVALKRTGCDVWQLECQASNVTASVQSDHLLRGYMLPVVLPLINRIVLAFPKVKWLHLAGEVAIMARCSSLPAYPSLRSSVRPSFVGTARIVFVSGSCGNGFRPPSVCRIYQLPQRAAGLLLWARLFRSFLATNRTTKHVVHVTFCH